MEVLFVDRELASLSELLIATIYITHVRFGTRVSIFMLLQVLRQGEG